jgi:hypothetical protein
MNKKLPYDLTQEEIQDLRNQKKRISEFVMKKFKKDEFLSSGEPHVFKMRLDDGYATYEYDLNLNENWCMHDIYTELAAVLKRYGCSIGVGELCGAGYLENETQKN